MNKAHKPDYNKEQIEKILSEMSVDEKIDQMLLMRDLHAVKKQLDNGEDIALYGSAFMTEDIDVDTLNYIQKKVIEKSPHKIPMIVMGEALHGVMNSHSTIFPQSIGMACSFDDELMEEIAGVIGREARSLGMRQVYAPDLDLAREPRWGRTEETFGEDPYLVSKMGLSYVKGVQKNGVASTLKHYVAHGSPECGLNLSPVHMGERELREVALPPFAECIKQGNALSVMPAYSEFDGVPVHASRFLLRKVLREELGFKGTTISDYDGITMLTYLHNIASDSLQCAKLALKAGINIEAPTDFAYNAQFRQAVKNGEIDVKYIDDAVRNVLYVKSELNLFSHPYIEKEDIAEVNGDYAKKLAKKAADESIVLLKNKDDILPLSKQSKIALVGVNAAVGQTGDYSYRNSLDKAISLLQAMNEKIGESNINYAKGCNIATAEEKDIDYAVEQVKKSDVAVVVLGDNSGFFGGIGWGDATGNNAVTCGEGFDVNTLDLPPVQKRLFNKVAETGKPVVLILYTGRPYAITDSLEKCDAFIQAWYPGEQGGNSLCDILFGDVCPSGKLSVSFPRSTGHIPCFYNHKPSARGANYKCPGTYDNPGRDYVFDNPNALFTFGDGLSYTAFDYSELVVKKTDHKVKVSVCVKNVGKYDGAESVLLFLRQTVCPVTPMVKKLRRFKRINLDKGESKIVEFYLDENDFTFIDFDMKEKVCHTKYIVMVGNLKSEIEI